ncbi:MAG: bifunctional hydroxymethylpyrimidine kinase/phosphomethylpyrimidine kinase [Mariprofundaceae bacterium]
MSVCLSIAGSDCSAGAGIQADLATFNACQTHGVSVITALTAQNTNRVLRIEPVPLAQIRAEMEAVFSYFDVAAVKTGMLVDAERVTVIAKELGRWHEGRPLVVDPVMVATSGACLLADDAIQVMIDKLFPLATIITPNIPEAERLLSRKIADVVDDAAMLAQIHDCAVLLKGGHGEGDMLIDALCDQYGEITTFSHQRIDGASLHGTGCFLSAAITAKLALGLPLHEAVETATNELQAILNRSASQAEPGQGESKQGCHNPFLTL